MPMIDGAIQTFSLTLDKFLQHAAKWHPRQEVVTYLGRGRTDRACYADIAARSLRISGALGDSGVGPGDRVATLAWNSRAHLETWFAIMGMGGVCLTLNPRLTSAQLADMAAQAEARILIVAADLCPLALEVARGAPAIERVLVIDGEVTDVEPDAAIPVLPLDDVAKRSRPDIQWGAFPETACSGLCFTSGTTGAPKGVSYTHRSSFLHTLRLLQADAMAITAADSVLAMVPMFHANAWGLPFAAPAVGAKLVLPGPHADGATIAQLIASEGVTVAVGVPTVWLGLLEHLDAHGGEVASLKRIVVGGAPLPLMLMDRIERRLGVVVQTSWGMTELSPSGTMSSPASLQRSAAVSGRPGVGVDLLLTNAEGQALPQQRDVEGHLRVRGAAVIERYFGQETPATDAEGWFSTGDLARIDADGNLMITGRAKDLIKSGGEWINPVEIENLVAGLDPVALAAVIARPDPKWGERPVLVVQLRDTQTITDEALLAPLRGRVASWWIPDAVIRIQSMPLAATGKIDKMHLRKAYGGG